MILHFGQAASLGSRNVRHGHIALASRTLLRKLRLIEQATKHNAVIQLM
jgi:hypothetical protein